MIDTRFVHQSDLSFPMDGTDFEYVQFEITDRSDGLVCRSLNGYKTLPSMDTIVCKTNCKHCVKSLTEDKCSTILFQS